MTNKNLLFLQLNEVNFQLVAKYTAKYDLPNLKKVLTWVNVELSSEKKYEDLEPWIQWVSVATGLEASEHKVFRLGDITKSDVKQIYEEVENRGHKVLALSPMNAKNNLKNSNFFLPDPWTDTPVSGGWLDKKIHISLRQAVNDNSEGRIGKLSILFLLIGVLTYSRAKNWSHYIRLALTSRNKKWNKALFLDLFLCDYFIKKKRRQTSGLSVLFLNSLAHIQHHYYKNSEFCSQSGKNPDWLVSPDEDPIFDGLQALNSMIADLVNLPNQDVLIATGLSQQEFAPFQYYYRLKDHEQFLSDLKVKYESVLPRMTRDFEISFLDNEARDLCANALDKVLIAGKPCFGVVDKRPLSLFVTLTHSKEISGATRLNNASGEYLAKDVVSFVALKNGEHSAKSWAFFSKGLVNFVPTEGSHVKSLYQTVNEYFD